MRKILPHPYLSATLFGIWLILSGSAALGTMLLALVLAVLIPLATARYWPEKTPRVRPLALAAYVALVLWDVVVASAHVAWIVLFKPSSQIQSAWISVPIDLPCAEARALLADALEQLGYQAESATWRNAYLMGAQELRSAPKPVGISTSNPDTVRGMSNELLFDFIALRLDHTKTDGIKAAVQMVFTDVNETWALELSNSVLNNTQGRVLKNPDLKLTLTRPAFLAMLLQGKKLPELVQAGMVKVEGNPQAFGAIVGAVMEFPPLFNIVTP